jgi:ATP-binding cassette subfamily A (ABC1) protein 3
MGFLKIPEFEDDDVKAEEQRVKESDRRDMQVRVANYSKIYTRGLSRTLAVRNCSFGLDFGECFALLGVNGAGKTTTFKSLTNEVHPSGGQVSVGGYDVTR